MNRWIAFALVLGSVLTAGAASSRAKEGWHLTFQAWPDGQVSEVRMAGANLRAGEVGSPEELIVGGDAFTVLDHQAHTYSVITYRQIETTVLPLMRIMKGSAALQDERLQGALDQLSPEERAKAEAVLRDKKGASSQAVSLEGTSDKAKVAGLPARKMMAMQDGKAVAEVWVTDAIPSEPLRDLLNRFVDMITAVAPVEEAGLLHAWPDLEGFPVRVVDLTGDTPKELLLLTAAEPADLPDSTFQPPADYTKQSMWLGNLGGGN